MAHGTHDHADDPRNAEVLVWVNGDLLPRDRAVVSVFDSGFVLGDGVWEGLRVSAGHPAFLERHLDRIEEGARALLLGYHPICSAARSTRRRVSAPTPGRPVSA